MNLKQQTDPIRFNPDFKYVRRVPTLVASTVQGTSEIARWVLDLNQILHIEEGYGPTHSVKKVNKLSGSDGEHNNPVLMHNDSLIFTAESVILYYDQLVPAARQLFPADEAQRKEVVEWYDLFTNTLNTYVWQYVWTELLSKRKYAMKLLKQDVGFWTKMGYRLFYGSAKRKLKKEWGLDGQDSVVYLVQIENIFAKVSEALKDGRKYLVGDKFSAADMAFAAIAAPLLVPETYGGAIARMNEVGEELRLAMIKMRATRAGQWALGVYQEDRPINLELGPVPKKPSLLENLFNPLAIRLTSNMGPVFYFLQKRLPVIKLGPIAAISRHNLVVEVLERDNDFMVRQINAKKMADQKGTFFLGMDRNDPQFDRERNYTRGATRRDDLDHIRSFVREQAGVVTQEVSALGRLDVVQRLNMVVLIRLLDFYFGVPAPVEAQMRKWQRTMFYDLFLNFTNNEEKHLAAVNSGKEREAWVRKLIDERHRILDAGGTIPETNLLNRLILMAREEQYGWVDDDIIRRQIGGLLTGIQETTSKAVIFVLQELFERPDQLKGAIAAAQKAYDDPAQMDLVRGYCYEALRFNPVQPGVLRYNETEQYLNSGEKKTYKIKPHKMVMALTSGAMFDPVTFPDPKTFKPDRDSRYMNWGFALHECYGKYINSVTIPELVTAVLRLPNVRQGKGAVGRGAGLKDGPFPNNYVVNFG